jgi:hypothetical protein
MRLSPRERREIAELLERALAAPLTRRLAAAPEIRREHHFAFSLGPRDPLVTGVLDLLAREEDGGALVVDYKTDSVLPEDDLEEAAARVEVVHWFLRRPHEAVSVVFRADERGALRARVAGRLGELRAKGFAVSERPCRSLCLTCPGRAALCSWPESETSREHPAAPRAEQPRGPGDERRLATLAS